MNPLFDIEENDKLQDSHGIWAEKYRPKTMDEFIGSEAVKEKPGRH
jgi:Holliday junction resolvasome RuvABC ATP-dependent DNA helicase subunit